ncbi:glucosidase 2 subunit beta-like protein [Blastocystis sp. subtype 4]|uniref:glucosidase 2 subunit beta-like protein n=1 Tax=Blastocystis sp. subtype 4 TaxID=944170 RepID=UPI0007116176|nr:glucosidase 2 subunit beta-like protein [Blastocystis sp. subtype 4]KNB45580.1 glucosidase 2 subunit beta-like protein [Blastocystis sp. subtype 4]|eukprot:XP_014529020.1 glucosidase 2 subunit beta-like protein [Blastocystis sp. subtype 4]
MPYDSPLSHIMKVAYRTSDVFYHYHFISGKNAISSVETRLMKTIRSKLYTLQSELDSLQASTEEGLKQYPPVTSCLLSQKGQCITSSFGQYSYSLCILGEAKQDNTKLGSWSLDMNRDYAMNRTIEYIGGTTCWNGIQRKLVVDFECGAREEIRSLSEPSTCQYYAVVKICRKCKEKNGVMCFFVVILLLQSMDQNRPGQVNDKEQQKQAIRAQQEANKGLSQEEKQALRKAKKMAKLAKVQEKLAAKEQKEEVVEVVPTAPIKQVNEVHLEHALTKEEIRAQQEANKNLTQEEKQALRRAKKAAKAAKVAEAQKKEVSGSSVSPKNPVPIPEVKMCVLFVSE